MAALDLRPVLYIAGALLSILALAMLIPASLDLALGHPDWRAFAASAAVTLFFGVGLMLACGGVRWRGFGLRQGFLMANLGWLLTALFGALPFAFSGLNLSFADSVFESMSGITTTGATVLEDLASVPPGILVWRALLNWLGGIGFIVTALALLPVLQVGGMQLFRIEAFTSERALPRAAEIGMGIGGLYVGLTAIGALLLWLLGVGPFDAVIHAMSGISTGGFSNYDLSVAAFADIGVQAVLIALMLCGAMPFLLLLRAVRGSPRLLLQDDQIRWLFGLVLAATLLVGAWLWLHGFYPPAQALWSSFFTVVSMMTGTGYRIADPSPWGGFPTAVLLVLMLTGGAAGSTACGVKLFRVQIFVSVALSQLRRLTQPHGVFIAHFNRRAVPDEISDAVMGFFFLFALTYVVLATGLGFMGLDFTTALSAAASVLANVGPGLGSTPVASGNFGGVPELAKWWLSIGMLLGRVEIITALVLLSRTFWRP